jgi:hypothetical protein
MNRRILTAREQVELLRPWRTAAGYDPDAAVDPNDLYAKFYSPVERNAKGHIRVHRGLIVPHDFDLNSLARNAGPHWSVNSHISEALADADNYGENDDDIGIVMSGWYDPNHPRHPDPDPLTGGSGYHSEQELTMLPDTPVHVDTVRWRPQGTGTDDSWRSMDWEPRQITTSFSPRRTAAT